MPEYTTRDLRNVVAVGHGGAGKTTLLDQMLFKAGAVTRAGSVNEKNSLFDFEDEEKERQNSIFSGMAFCSWKDTEFNLINTPGYSDFAGAATTGLDAGDVAMVAVAAPQGIELNTRKMWAASGKAGLSRIVVITKMDGENIVDYNALIERVREVFGSECIRVNLPVGLGASFSGVVDLVNPPNEAPENVLGDVSDAANALMEKIVEVDEALMERYLNDENISSEELAGALAKSISDGSVVPVLHVSGTSGAGVEELMNFLSAYGPSPLGRAIDNAGDPKSGEDVSFVVDSDGPLAAKVYKTVTDPFVGKLAFFKVLRGEISADSQVLNVRTGKKVRMAHLFRVFGKEHRQVESAVAGDLMAVSKIDDIQLGDSLCDPAKPVELPATQFAQPMVSLALEPKTRGDEQKLGSSLQKLADEDPTFTIHRDQQTKELVATGMSQLHLDVVLQRLKRRYSVDVATKPPRIPYKETITVPSEASYRHKKQTGGRGQFGEVWFKLEPLERGTGFEFVDKIVGGAIPNNFIPAVEKGVRERLQRGVLAGYVVEDVRVILHFGKYHDVDSSEAAFKLAASHCFQDAFMKAKPVLLEPVVELEITIPGRFMGDITGDLNSRRGRILGMDSEGEYQTIRAEVPMSEVMQYATELRSMSGGTASHTMEFSRYDVVPGRQTEAIVAKAKQAREDANK